MGQREIVATDHAPKAIGPYSQGIRVGELLFASGQIPLDPVSGEVVTGGVADQTERALTNLQAVLAAAGVGLKDVVKTTLYIKNMADFGLINEIYAKYFQGEPPARSCVEVARLPKDVSIEVEAIAFIEKN